MTEAFELIVHIVSKGYYSNEIGIVLKAGLFISSCGGMLEQILDLKSLADEFASQVRTMVVGR